MIEKTLIIYILLGIKLRNGKMKIVIAGSVKFTLTKEKKSLDNEKKSKNLGSSSSIFGIMAVAYQCRFATNKFKLLFYLFNRLFLAD